PVVADGLGVLEEAALARAAPAHLPVPVRGRPPEDVPAPAEGDAEPVRLLDRHVLDERALAPEAGGPPLRPVRGVYEPEADDAEPPRRAGGAALRLGVAAEGAEEVRPARDLDVVRRPVVRHPQEDRPRRLARALDEERPGPQVLPPKHRPEHPPARHDELAAEVRLVGVGGHGRAGPRAPPRIAVTHPPVRRRVRARDDD